MRGLRALWRRGDSLNNRELWTSAQCADQDKLFTPKTLIHREWGRPSESMWITLTDSPHWSDALGKRRCEWVRNLCVVTDWANTKRYLLVFCYVHITGWEWKKARERKTEYNKVKDCQWAQKVFSLFPEQMFSRLNCWTVILSPLKYTSQTVAYLHPVKESYLSQWQLDLLFKSSIKVLHLYSQSVVLENYWSLLAHMLVWWRNVAIVKNSAPWWTAVVEILAIISCLRARNVAMVV